MIVCPGLRAGRGEEIEPAWQTIGDAALGGSDGTGARRAAGVECQRASRNGKATWGGVRDRAIESGGNAAAGLCRSSPQATVAGAPKGG